MRVLHHIIILFVILCGVEANAQESFYTVSGKVRDNQTRRPLEYVTITVANYNIGTVTNADGEFSLKIPNNINASSVDFSHLGYRSFHLSVQGESMLGVEVLLSQSAVVLSDVIVSGGDARYIVKEAVKKIPKNYSSSLNQLTGFYRETVQKRNNYINISEAVIDLYKTPYTEYINLDRLQY